ncbi:hypothetical protein DL771_009646 [Monosporascus sp. 5C6A]|nr:hypothetical protein DL771_009646 [Monosporascus sp. 5C6A]
MPSDPSNLVLTYKPVNQSEKQTLVSRVRILCTPRGELYNSYVSLKPEDSGELALGAATLECLELGELEEPLVPGEVSGERVYDDENDGDFWGATDAGLVAQ